MTGNHGRQSPGYGEYTQSEKTIQLLLHQFNVDYLINRHIESKT